MEKSDLKDGMILVTRGAGTGILLAGRLKDFTNLCSEKGISDIKNLNNDLTHKHKDMQDYAIDKVYKITDMYKYSLAEILRELPLDAVELLWQREREIDWSKVPKWTPVQVKDNSCACFSDVDLLVAYESELKEYPFLAVGEPKEQNQVNSWRYCRIHPDVEIKEDWYK